jgi:hypothetical protein
VATCLGVRNASPCRRRCCRQLLAHWRGTGRYTPDSTIPCSTSGTMLPSTLNNCECGATSNIVSNNLPIFRRVLHLMSANVSFTMNCECSSLRANLSWETNIRHPLLGRLLEVPLSSVSWSRRYAWDTYYYNKIVFLVFCSCDLFSFSHLCLAFELCSFHVNKYELNSIIIRTFIFHSPSDVCIVCTGSLTICLTSKY